MTLHLLFRGHGNFWQGILPFRVFVCQDFYLHLIETIYCQYFDRSMYSKHHDHIFQHEQVEKYVQNVMKWADITAY